MNRFGMVCALLLASVGVVASAPEKVALVCKAQVGQTARYRSTGTLTVESAGQKVTVEIDDTEKCTFTEVAADGTITSKRENESSKMRVNGQEMPRLSKDEAPVVVSFRPDGSLVSYKAGSDEPGASKLGIRMHPATNPLYPPNPVGVGDKWSRDIKANADTGAHAGHAECEVQGFEKVAGVDTVKVHMTYRETDTSPAISSQGTYWIERGSGDQVLSEIDIENIPFGSGATMALASGKLRQERLSGGPLASSTTPEAPGGTKTTKTIDEVVKDFEKLPGVVTMYRKRETGRDTIYMEIREDQLGANMMLQATASTGTAEQVVAGDPLNDILFRFVMSGDDRVMMEVPNINFRADERAAINRSVKRSFADAYLEVFKVEARQPDRKSLLINVSDLFRGDIAEISRALSGGGIAAALGLGGGGGYSLDREKTFVSAIKAFPDNVVVETAYNFTRSGSSRLSLGGSVLADSRSIPIRVIYNLWQLKETGYRPRIADPRVGFFYTEYTDFTDDSKPDLRVRYVTRWNLEKADPKALLSAPKKPIVFWLDNAIPLEYRAAVKDGILLWNRAFEKVGIRDAIVVKQMPDNADWDHADMRYNVIRWSTTEAAPYGAVALPRVNPLTGEVINAAITVDASLARSAILEQRYELNPASWFDQNWQSAPRKIDPRRCDYALQARDQAWFGYTALRMLDPVAAQLTKRDYTNSFIRIIVCHEFGHVLGLFHNFVASTNLSLKELADPKRVRRDGVTASVMDYVPFNIAAIKHKGVDYYSTSLGAYDTWAIQYGYTPIDAKTPSAELPILKKIASRSNEPGHRYENDFMADQFDPLVTRFDLARDPLDYWTRVLQVDRYLLMTLSKREPANGESYYEFSRLFYGLLNMYARAAAVSSRYVGAMHVNRNHRGDAHEKATLVPADAGQQLRALNLLRTYVLSESALRFPVSYYTHLTGNPFPSMTGVITGGNEFPIRDTLSSLQRSALRSLFSPTVLRRVSNNEFRMSKGKRALTIPTLFHTVDSAVWSELAGGRNIDPLRRQLQRAHLDLLVEMTTSPSTNVPDDARMMAWDGLRSLRGRLTVASRRHSDEYTRVHLQESLMRVNRALEARQVIGGQSAPQQSLLERLLSGGETLSPALP